MEDTVIARRLRQLRNERDWSPEELAGRSAASRATPSRLEGAAVRPTIEVLGKLCSAFGMTLSRLVSLAEEDYPALLRHADQVTWVDEACGFRRRTVSPPASALAAEVVDCLCYRSFGRTEFRNRAQQPARYVQVLAGGRA